MQWTKKILFFKSSVVMIFTCSMLDSMTNKCVHTEDIPISVVSNKYLLQPLYGSPW